MSLKQQTWHGVILIPKTVSIVYEYDMHSLQDMHDMHSHRLYSILRHAVLGTFKTKISTWKKSKRAEVSARGSKHPVTNRKWNGIQTSSVVKGSFNTNVVMGSWVLFRYESYLSFYLFFFNSWFVIVAVSTELFCIKT